MNRTGRLSPFILHPSSFILPSLPPASARRSPTISLSSAARSSSAPPVTTRSTPRPRVPPRGRSVAPASSRRKGVAHESPSWYPLYPYLWIQSGAVVPRVPRVLGATRRDRLSHPARQRTDRDGAPRDHRHVPHHGQHDAGFCRPV